jgi:hypothetical protein
MASEQPEQPDVKFQCSGCNCLFENLNGLFIIGGKIYCDYCLYEFDMDKMKLIHCNGCGVLSDSDKGFQALKKTSKANYGPYTSPTVCGTCKESGLIDFLNNQTGIDDDDWRDAEKKDMASPEEIKSNDFTKELNGVLGDLEGMPQIAMTIFQIMILRKMAEMSKQIGKLLVENRYLKFQVDDAKDCEIDDIKKLYDNAKLELEEKKYFDELEKAFDEAGIDIDD